MSKEEIIDYVMNSPENTNPSVLRSLLDREGGGFLGGAFVITSTYDETADGIKMDHTWQEIVDATLAGKQCMLVSYDNAYDPPVLQYINTSLDIHDGTSGGNWSVIVYDITSSEQNKYLNYYTNSADGYPVYYPD